MILKTEMKILLPTQPYGNIEVTVGAQMDTADPKDLDSLNLSSEDSTARMYSALREAVDQELFATKDVLEGRPPKDFKLSFVK